jgi:formylmethanofuran dehydrogenase subunit B
MGDRTAPGTGAVAMPGTTPDRASTCLACGLLCDDIEVRVEPGDEDGPRIVAARNTCELGASWFLRRRKHADGSPLASIDGLACSDATALERAARLLGRARRPVVLGLIQSSLEAQRRAVAVADLVGAAIEPSHASALRPRLRAYQRVGRVGATLGEVAQRADRVVLWACDPSVSHPRFFERFVDREGRFVAGGERLVLRVGPADDFASLTRLRLIVAGKPEDGATTDDERAWAHAMLGARYGAIVHAGRPNEEAGQWALMRLVRDLNGPGRRFVALGLAGPGNPAGAEAALAWQTGFPAGCDLRSGAPVDRPGESEACALLAEGRADLALIVGDDPPLKADAAAHLGSVPRIVIAPDATDPARGAAVGFSSAVTGLEGGGTVVRSDGAPIPLEAPLAASAIRPTDHAWLTLLHQRLGSGA